MYILFDEKGRTYLTKGKELHTDLGKVNLANLKEGALKSHIGRKFYAVKANINDILAKAKRGPQVILHKDAGMIVLVSGLKPGDKVLDAGTGSGFLAAYLANIVGAKGKVITYEKRKEFANVAKENFKALGLKNIELVEKDVYEEVKGKNYDLITLDLAEPWKVPNLDKLVKIGGYVISYLPQITQVQKFTDFINKTDRLKLVKVSEVLEREWDVTKKIVRPKSQMIGHTAFLVFARRLY